MTTSLDRSIATPSTEPPNTNVLATWWTANPEALAVIARDGTILHANGSFQRRLGANAYILAGEFGDSAAPERLSREEPRGRRRLIRYACADGSVRAIWTSVVGLDASEEANAAFALSLNHDSDGSTPTQNPEGFEQPHAIAPLAIVEWDTEGRVTRWNESAERIFGWSAAEMLGHDFFPRIIPDIATDQVREVVRALLRGEFANARNANITKGGEFITCQWYNTLLRNESGQVVGVISQAEDVSHEERAKQELLESKTLLTSLIDNLPIAIALKDERGRHQLVNRLFEEWNGKSRDEIQGKTDGECWPADIARSREQGAKDAIERGTPRTREETIRQAQGETRECSVLEFPIYDRAGAIQSVCSVTTDLTAVRRASEEREHLQQQLIESQQKTLRELSTPLLPVADGVLVMPLVGHIDSGRSAMIMETLLHGIPDHGASVAILDITGVRDIDHSTAEAIIMAARAGKMLGADVLLTGMRPNVARALVDNGSNLEGIVSLGTLRAGINYALQRNRRR